MEMRDAACADMRFRHHSFYSIPPFPWSPLMDRNASGRSGVRTPRQGV